MRSDVFLPAWGGSSAYTCHACLVAALGQGLDGLRLLIGRQSGLDRAIIEDPEEVVHVGQRVTREEYRIAGLHDRIVLCLALVDGLPEIQMKGSSCSIR